MRYIRFFAFLLSLAVLLALVECVLRAVGAPISLRDSRGVGQVLMLTISLLWLMAFVEFVAHISSIRFLMHYVRHWRRALAGFLTVFLVVILLSAVIFGVFVWFGWATWSQEHWAALDLLVIAIVIKSLFVALTLATTEELIFRASFLRYLRYSLRPGPTIAAIVVSSVVFSVSHLIALREAHDGVLPLLTGLFLLGILLGTTYVVTGSIACSIGLHLGLLGFKVILHKSDIGSFGGDVRTGPDFYLMMILLTAIVVLMRRQLWARFSIEPAALLDSDIHQKRISSFEPGGAPNAWG